MSKRERKRVERSRRWIMDVIARRDGGGYEFMSDISLERFCLLVKQLDHESAEVIHLFHTNDGDRIPYLREAWLASRNWDHGMRWYTNEWDTDPRELYDIPEAIALCKAILAEGWLAVLATDLDENGLLVGGLSLWLTGTGQKPVNGQFTIDSRKYRKAVQEANAICAERFGEPR